ncbi:MAG: hypothetical protein AAFN70_06360, partial [Planctomycetota bacterium]
WRPGCHTPNPCAIWDLPLAVIGILFAIVVTVYGLTQTTAGQSLSFLHALWLAPLIASPFAFWYANRWLRCNWIAGGIRKHMRVGNRDRASLRRVLLSIPAAELANQPLPRFGRTDDRYELLRKFQGVVRQLGFQGIIVLVDRVDEPDLTGGNVDLMRRFVWPLLDNKLLKHPGVGFKMMLSHELYDEFQRESRDFHERARLDKQNVIPEFVWTGESMYDLVLSRMQACAADGRTPRPNDIFEPEISNDRLLGAFQSLRVPRHLFRFLYRLLVEHCNNYSDSDPNYRINNSTFEKMLAVYSSEIRS